MRVSILSALLLLRPLAALPPSGFTVLSEDRGAWPEILGCVGFQPVPASRAGIFVARSGAAASAEWPGRVERGAYLILEGESSLAALFGFHPDGEYVRVGSLTDARRPRLPIIWQKALELPRFEIPKAARVFARERWSGAPMLAGFRSGAGAVLWLATSPGERGYERFPYILHALDDLGLQPPVRSSRLWAFFDSAYRSRVDLDYFAARWRAAGIAALHVAAWHFFEPDPAQDAYLRKLISACHQRGILVYAWFELPHVSEKFWKDHPEWREQTALLQDAQLDWRKLMNLANPDCARAAAAGVRDLVGRFDWDGVNLAELYFESLEGASNPSRFTPMNADVRAAFRRRGGFDPLELFQGRKDPKALRAFLDFRAELARRIEQDWIEQIETLRRTRPDLDLVLTHVDDRFDRGMRDAIGADSAGVLPLLDQHRFIFLIEDPATVWHLGPQRYAEIARRYQPLTPHAGRLAIDINVVDRYQDVYPTRQQTGTELFQLVHQAARSFPRVALYFENSLLSPDWKLLSSSAANPGTDGKFPIVDSPHGVGIPWTGPALVDGRPWPVASDSTLWLPAGSHRVEPASRTPIARVLDFNGDLKSAQILPDGRLEIAYESSSRAFAILNRRPLQIEIDGIGRKPEPAGGATLALPRGQHLVTIMTE